MENRLAVNGDTTEKRSDASNACLLVHNSKNVTQPAESFVKDERDHLPSHVHIYEKDIKVFIPSTVTNPTPSKRKRVQLFSNASCRRLLFVCRNSGHNIKSQFTLTYHNNIPSDGKGVKKQLNTFLTNMRQEWPDLCYLWVLEFQKRGAVHFHVFTNVEHTNEKFRKSYAKHWNRIVEPESKQHLAWHQHQNNFIAWDMKSGKYLAKEYLAKATQKDIPEEYQNVGRFWGNSRNMKPVPAVLDPAIIPEFIMTYAIRNTAKQREKILSKYAGCKIKLRGKHRSFSMPLMSTMFITMLTYMGAFSERAEQVLF